jgi:hypothetical protein
LHSQAFAAASIHGDKARPNKKPVLLLTFVIILHAWLCLLMIMFVICTCWYPYWSRPADTAPEMPPKAPERTRPPAPHLLNISGAERSAPNRRRKSVTFRRRPVDFPAPETTCLIVFPAPSWGLSGAGDYLFDRFSGAGNNLFVRTDRFPAPSWGPSGAHLFHYVCSYLCAW